MLSNGLHGQRYHSLTVFVPTIKCPHYCQLAQHLYPERHQEHMGCRQGRRESCLELRESCLERRERESCLERRERERAVWSAERAIKSTGGTVTSGCLPRVCYDWCFVRAGKGRLVTTAATAGGLRLVFGSGWLGRAG